MTTQTHVGATHRQWVSTTTYHTYPLNEAPPTFDGWYNGTHSFQRLQRGNTTLGVNGPAHSPDKAPPTRQRSLSLAYASANDTTVTTTDGLIRLQMTRPPASTALTELGVENVSDWTFTATLTGDGRVIEYRVVYTATVSSLDGERVTGETVVSVAVPAEMDVDRPEWVPRVQNATDSPT